jgi:hypothetical protein
VIDFTTEQYDAWKKGDRSLLPPFIEHSPAYDNQRKYHFGEIFVIATYSRLYGWKGFHQYRLGLDEPDNPKYVKSREFIARRFPKGMLAEYQRLNPSGIGEPDVMLYDDAGRFLFLEVKKDADKVKPEQFRALALIKSILDADVGIVYLRREGKSHTPKTYELDLESFSGSELKESPSKPS